MSYKSILDRIQALESSAELRRYTPERTRKLPRRRLYLSKAAVEDFANSASAVNALCGKGFIDAALTKWTLGERVHSDGKAGRFLKDLEPPPPEVWEIRVTEPTVQARLISRFAQPDTLILMKFYTRRLLGKKGSPEWKRATQNCETQWNKLFPDHPPFSAQSISEYVTENCDDFPIKKVT